MRRHVRAGKGDEEKQGHQVEEVEQRAYVEEAHHLPSADVLTQVGLYCQYRQLLHGKSHKDVDKEIIKDKSAKYADRVLAGEDLMQGAPGGQTCEKHGRQKIGNDEAHKDLGDKAPGGVATAPEGLPLMRQ